MTGIKSHRKLPWQSGTHVGLPDPNQILFSSYHTAKERLGKLSNCLCVVTRDIFPTLPVCAACTFLAFQEYIAAIANSGGIFWN